MAQVLKNESDLEQRVQKVEQLMRELDVQIHRTYDGLGIEDMKTGKTYNIMDTEMFDGGQQFPRQLESERLFV